jgi:hypothetical protein
VRTSCIDDDDRGGGVAKLKKEIKNQENKRVNRIVFEKQIPRSCSWGPVQKPSR